MKQNTIKNSLEPLLSFDADWPDEVNTLLIQRAMPPKLFVADSDGRHTTYDISELKHLKPVSLAAALRWYVRCNSFADSSSGNMDVPCMMAAEALERQAATK